MHFPNPLQKTLGPASELPQIPMGFNFSETKVTTKGKPVSIAVKQTDRRGNHLPSVIVPITLARMGTDALVICTVNGMRAHVICSLDSKIDLSFEVHRFLNRSEEEEE